ncbi:shufflon system plasmid conjugative transfer pilus tip adhesin PilV [Pseudomonas gingeri NCPPB 3146 = LMG 5327]|uniref:Shufflon system plasmid conjugative transfer pilus tip adhesin PilV n=2 Tax=Pseudomonas gingeri TaxID=117681 RepID=A0A7Y8CF31_9PSED|nr:shufflon system plasmid conjugative transfer pilus tip adhesin PilV [Pseudomonas gingeri]NWC16514.1 shufflon system plasmid conjugative transfer pilus tip adhesin PilV [Pseudomonas gingeri]PNQ91160.1 shufflon system plasmid conjugative transfer pilus tip adhesin PilV [Pseudomonas gingeri NCPPB 3146 = LMG 5327]
MNTNLNWHKQQRGFIAIEYLFAIIAFSLMTVIGANLASKWMDSQNYQIAAQQQQTAADAAAKYLKDNISAVLALATPTVPAQITVAMLRNTNYLPAGFSDTNAFGQSFLVLARSPAPNQLESIVITTGGETIDEIGTREIAENLGGTGGFIPVSNASIVQGVRGGWQITLSNYGMNPGVGHTASALFLQDGSLANDYLYRNAIPGKPELNRMNTDLDMGANNVNNAANITASGTVTAGADVNAAGNVTGTTAKITGETYTGNWFRTQGDTGWYSEKWGGGWYMSDSDWIRAYGNKSVYTPGQSRAGSLASEGRTEVGEYLQLDGLAVENTACTPNGLVGRMPNGSQLTCQDSVWKAGSARVQIPVYQCPTLYGGTLGGGDWGFYGCTGQITNQPGCLTVESPNIQWFACSYVGTYGLN